MCTPLESTVINQRTGFFKELIPVESFIKPIELYIYAPIYFIKPDTIEANSNLLSISGAGLSHIEAKEKCLGEAIERYCWYYAGYWAERIHTSFNKIKEKAIPPENYALFSNAQYAKKGFPFIPFRENTHLDWVKGVRFEDQKPLYVPSQFCFPIKNGKSRICYYTTTGLACSDNYFKAIYTSICEVIERDAFMLMWLNKMKPQLIEIKWRESSRIKTIIEFLKISRYRCLIFRLKNEINIPVFMTMMVNKEKGSPYVALGMACDLDVAKAIRKSLLESLHNLNFLLWAQHNNISIKWKEGKTTLKNFDDHALLYANPQMNRRLSFILNAPHSKENIISHDLEEDFDYKEVSHKLMDRIAENGYQVVTVDLTPHEVKNMGLHVIKALIPGFIDLGFNGYNCLGTKRIIEIPQKLGFDKKNRIKLNTFPHPFP